METPMRVRLVQEVEGVEYIVEERASAPPATFPRFALEKPKDEVEDDGLPEGWKEERLIDDGGEEIFIRYRGDPNQERYTFIRDYLDFKRAA